eukprot:jgi/Chlat1/4075/Chrsp26S04115
MAATEACIRLSSRRWCSIAEASVSAPALRKRPVLSQQKGFLGGVPVRTDKADVAAHGTRMAMSSSQPPQDNKQNRAPAVAAAVAGGGAGLAVAVPQPEPEEAAQTIEEAIEEQQILPVNVSGSVVALILGGGESRNFPLTRYRAKPAVPLGANYRLVDIPVSNCINSGISKIYVLTQFNSLSLNSHIANAFPPYAFGGFGTDNFVEVVAASQDTDHMNWFQGSADAVRRYLYLFDSPMGDPDENCQEFLVLSGEQLYRMDYSKLIAQHRASGADITVATTPVDPWHVFRLGVMRLDENGYVTDFAEKPTSAETLKAMQRCSRYSSDEKPFIASMGVYVFNRNVLHELLDSHPEDLDFGRHVMARAMREGYKISTYIHEGYWNDVSTLEHFYHANLDQAKMNPPPFNFFDKDFPIYTAPRHLPPSVINDCDIQNTLVGEGCVVNATYVHGSVLGLCTHIDNGAMIEDTMVCGGDYLQSEDERQAIFARGEVPIGIGENSFIRGAIIDKNACIGKNVRICNVSGVRDLSADEEGYVISSGIVTILKNAVIPDGTEI